MSPRSIPTKEFKFTGLPGTVRVETMADRELESKLVALEQPEPAAREVKPFLVVRVVESKIGPEKVTARNVKISKMAAPKVSRLKLEPLKSVKGHLFKFSFREIGTSFSGMMDKKSITREMLDLKYYPYPLLSEIISEMAEKNQVGFSQVKLVGIFDPIPSELISSIKLDSYSGKLKFTLSRPDRKKKPRCVRMAYGRLRTDDRIVQIVLPLN